MIAANFHGPKMPKLEEAIWHFFQEKLEGAHDALVDAKACGRLYFHLVKMEAEAAAIEAAKPAAKEAA